MSSTLIVGSGASGIHFALSLLKKGYHVTVLDVGWQKPEPANPTDHWKTLKANLTDPVGYFLGKNFEAAVLPGEGDEYLTKYYGFPPSKSHVFMLPDGFKYEAHGFIPILSFAQGGLAEAWTGGAYPFNDDDLKQFPFKYQDIKPYYSEVARRIGLIGVDDDLARFFPLHENLLAPLQLDVSSTYIMQEYQKHRLEINRRLKCYLGRSRVTTQSVDTPDRKACTYCGRCLWGCPTESLYTPSLTLKECLRHPNFQYLPGMLVKYFRYDKNGHVTCIVAESLADHLAREFSADRYVLAAGALASSKIFMTSIYQATGEFIKLFGLMDNRQILVPFINLKMLGKTYDPESYQYHQLAIGFNLSNRPEEYIHGQITTLKTALSHPVIQNVPFDQNTAIKVFRNVRSGLGVVNINLFDRRRETNFLTLREDPETGETRLAINYTPMEQENQLIKESIRRIKQVLWKLTCIVPPGMIQIRPSGASVHYSGILPMSETPAPHHVSKYCQSHDFENLFIVDGSTMPFLPAKNITFTLMANAVRVADQAF